MGLNEFAGYVAVAVAALASGWAAQQYGLRTGPAYLGVGVAIAGLTLSTLFVRDTTAHVALEESRRASSDNAAKPPLLDVMRRSLWSDRGLFSTSQAGLVNNLNDGLAWGVFPLFFAAAGLDVRTATILVASYPAVWGMTQLVTGPLGDRWGRKPLIVAGMVLQGVALVGLSASRRQGFWIAEMVALGVGTALVYPTLLAAVADVARPSWRGTAVGVYRLWRDLGYVVGALLAGVLVDALGMREAIAAIGMLTIGSGVLFAVRFTERPRAS